MGDPLDPLHDQRVQLPGDPATFHGNRVPGQSLLFCTKLLHLRFELTDELLAAT